MRTTHHADEKQIKKTFNSSSWLALNAIGLRKICQHIL